MTHTEPSDSVLRFIQTLQDSPTATAVFNPWYHIDAIHDVNDAAPQIRREHLAYYLSERIGRAEYCLLGEAIGYQGGHFSGMAMTSERILLGHQSSRGIMPDHVFSQMPRRTSKEPIRPLGFSEPTATIVWGCFAKNNINPFRIVIWNTFAWHPYHTSKGMLSNRTPTDAELEYGLPVLKEFLSLFPQSTRIAVGAKAKICLDTLGYSSYPVRHPANGGATKFQDQFLNIINADSKD